MASSIRIARAAPTKKAIPAKKSAPAAKKVTTRTAKDRRAQPSPIARVVSQREVTKRTRRFIFLGLSLSILAIAVMMTVVIFQTRIAETQLQIDKIESQISAERDRYDALRLERSSLRDPSRLVTEATAMGMIPGNGTDFVAVEPIVMAQVLVATGGIDVSFLSVSHDPLTNYGAVKATIGDRP